MNNSDIATDELKHELKELRTEYDAKKSQYNLLSLNLHKLPILEYAGVGIFGIDINGKHNYVNPKASSLLGYDTDELLGKQSHTLWHHSYADGQPMPIEECPIYQTLKDGKTHQDEDYFWCKDGSGFYVEYTSMPILENDLITGAVVTFSDITKRKQAEKELSQFKRAVESSGEVIFITDISGLITYVNPEFTNLYGYTSDEVVGKSTPRILKSGILDQETYKYFWKTILNKQVIKGELINKSKDGRTITVEGSANPIIDDQGNIIGFLAVQRDITDRKLAEKAILHAQNEWELTFNAITDMITIHDNNYNIIRANDAAQKILGIPFESLHNAKCYKHYHGTDAPPEGCPSCNCLLTEKVSSFEIFEKNLNLYVEIRAIPRFDSDNKLSGLIHIVRDITNRKEAEKETQSLIEQLGISNETIENELFEKNCLIQELEISKSSLNKINSAKDKFFSIIAHDLRSPFSGFLGLTKILAEKIQELSMKELQEFSFVMKDSAHNLYKLLENLLEWARMQRGVTEFNPELCMLSFIIKQNIDVLNEFARQKNIKLLLNVEDSMNVYADVPMLNTVLRNLISNAIKFTPKGGIIEIGYNKSSDDSKPSDDCVYIKDSGIGMDADTLGKLFKLEEKVSRPGTEGESSTGLGLLLCKEFIEKHGGKIWVQSEESKGSTFYFTLHNNI